MRKISEILGKCTVSVDWCLENDIDNDLFVEELLIVNMNSDMSKVNLIPVDKNGVFREKNVIENIDIAFIDNTIFFNDLKRIEGYLMDDLFRAKEFAKIKTEVQCLYSINGCGIYSYVDRNRGLMISYQSYAGEMLGNILKIIENDDRYNEVDKEMIIERLKKIIEEEKERLAKLKRKSIF